MYTETFLFRGGLPWASCTGNLLAGCWLWNQRKENLCGSTFTQDEGGLACWLGHPVPCPRIVCSWFYLRDPCAPYLKPWPFPMVLLRSLDFCFRTQFCSWFWLWFRSEVEFVLWKKGRGNWWSGIRGLGAVWGFAWWTYFGPAACTFH